VVNDARRAHQVGLDALRDVLPRNPLHPGTKLLRPFIDNPANPTASAPEDLFLAFIKKYNLPTPVVELTLRSKQPDAYFPQHNLIVPTIRITEPRLTTDPDREAIRLNEILDRLLRR
jgi:hypothetical protein